MHVAGPCCGIPRRGRRAIQGWSGLAARHTAKPGLTAIGAPRRHCRQALQAASGLAVARAGGLHSPFEGDCGRSFCNAIAPNRRCQQRGTRLQGRWWANSVEVLEQELSLVYTQSTIRIACELQHGTDVRAASDEMSRAREWPHALRHGRAISSSHTGSSHQEWQGQVVLPLASQRLQHHCCPWPVSYRPPAGNTDTDAASVGQSRPGADPLSQHTA